MNELTQARLMELLVYNQDSGEFFWKIQRCNVAAGQATGSRSGNGYLYIRVDKKLHSAHRLAWLYVFGSFPKVQVDHVNGSRSDNSICNLRLVTNGQNQQNRRGAQSTSSTGLMGVTYSATTKGKHKYSARIKKDGITTYLGYFATPDKAHAVYLKAKRQIHEFCEI